MTLAVCAVACASEGVGEADSDRPMERVTTTTSRGAATCRGAIGATASRWGSLDNDSGTRHCMCVRRRKRGGWWQANGAHGDDDDKLWRSNVP